MVATQEELDDGEYANLVTAGQKEILLSFEKWVTSIKSATPGSRCFSYALHVTLSFNKY